MRKPTIIRKLINNQYSTNERKRFIKQISKQVMKCALLIVFCVTGLIGCNTQIASNKSSFLGNKYFLEGVEGDGYRFSAPLTAYVENMMNDTYLDGLIPKHVVETDVVYLDLSSVNIDLTLQEQASLLSEVANFKNLMYLDISDQDITDLTPISNLTELMFLYANHNQISDLTSLAELSNLSAVSFDYNEIIMNEANIALLSQWGMEYIPQSYSKYYLDMIEVSDGPFIFHPDNRNYNTMASQKEFRISIQPMNAKYVNIHHSQVMDIDCDHANLIESIETTFDESYTIELDLFENSNAIQVCLYGHDVLHASETENKVPAAIYLLAVNYQKPAITTTPVVTTSRPATKRNSQSSTTPTPKETTAATTTMPATVVGENDELDPLGESEQISGADVEVDIIKPEIPDTGDVHKVANAMGNQWDYATPIQSFVNSRFKIPNFQTDDTASTSVSYATNGEAVSKPLRNVVTAIKSMKGIHEYHKTVLCAIPNATPIVTSMTSTATLISQPKTIPLITNNQTTVSTRKSTRGHSLNPDNPDYFGWLSFDALDINYPVFLGNDNKYYLKHDQWDKYSRHGELFLDWKYQSGDQVKVIYGHHMRDGTMFAPILQVMQMEELPTVVFMELEEQIKSEDINQSLTEAEHKMSEYEVVGAYYYDTRTDYFDYIRTHYEDINELIDFVGGRNVLRDIVEMKQSGEFLLLSTCNYDSKGDRFVLVLQKKVVNEMLRGLWQNVLR